MDIMKDRNLNNCIARFLQRANFGRICCIGLALIAMNTHAGWKDRMEALDQRYERGVFRIFYATSGEDAFNTAPDVSFQGESTQALIDILADQLQWADWYYSVNLGLMPPLTSPKYQHVRAIDVHVRSMDDKSGSAGDAAVIYRYRHFGNYVPALTISISTRWRPKGVTPEHEVFHSYQYGYTFFKNSWFLEGLARSMERPFRGKPGAEEPLPNTPMELKSLLDRSYSAAPVWTRLKRLCDPTCKVAKTDTPFRRDAKMCGGAFIKTVLESLQQIDPDAAKARGINPDNWPEKEQYSSQNNPWILKGLSLAMERRCPISRDAELAAFHRLLK